MARCRVGDCQKSRENLDKKRIMYAVRSAESMLVIISHFKIIFERIKSVAFTFFKAISFAVGQS